MKNFKLFLIWITSSLLAVTHSANTSAWDSKILIENNGLLINKVEMQSETSTGGFNVRFIMTTYTTSGSSIIDKYFNVVEDTVSLILNLDGNDRTEGRTWIDTFEIGELQIGTYILKAQVTSNEGNDEEVISFNLGVSGFDLNRNQDETVVVYPNPSSDFIIVKSSEINLFGNVEILDSKGSLIKTSLLNQGKQYINGLPNGIYILKFHLGDLVTSKRIVINK